MPVVPDTAAVKTKCQNCAVRNHAICGALQDDELSEINKISRQRSYKAGETIVSDTEPADFFANVISGVIKLSKTLPDGRQQIVGLLFAPDFLGRAYRTNHTYFAEAATDVDLCCFPNEAFERLLQKFSGLEHRLFAYTLDELDSAREWMLLLGRKTAEEKVANFLLMLASRSNILGCDNRDVLKPNFELPLTRADVADYLGLTIETVSRQISKLKARKVITLKDNRLVQVEDLEKLRQLSGDDSLY